MTVFHGYQANQRMQTEISTIPEIIIIYYIESEWLKEVFMVIAWSLICFMVIVQ